MHALFLDEREFIALRILIELNDVLGFRVQPHGHVPDTTRKRGVVGRPLASLQAGMQALQPVQTVLSKSIATASGGAIGFADAPRSCRSCPCSPAVVWAEELWRRCLRGRSLLECLTTAQRYAHDGAPARVRSRPGPERSVSTPVRSHRPPLWKTCARPYSLLPPPRQRQCQQGRLQWTDGSSGGGDWRI